MIKLVFEERKQLNYSCMKLGLIMTLLFCLLPTLCLAQTAEDAQSLHDKGRACFYAGMLAEGREYTLQAMELRKYLFGEVSEDYITSLNNYALSFSMDNNFDKAIELQTKVLQLCDKLPKPHKNIGMYTMNMGRFYYLKKDNDNAIKYCEKALPLVEKHGELYEQLLEWLGVIYIDSRNVEGQARIMALTEEHNQHELTLPCDESGCMTERAEYYAATGNRAQAKDCYLKALGMAMDLKQKTETYESYAKFLSDERNWNNSAEYYYMAAEAKKLMAGENEEYIQLVYNAAVRMYLGKQYKKSLGYYDSVLAFYERLKSKPALKNIALCHKGKGNVLLAMNYYTAAKDEYKQVLNYFAQVQPKSEEHASAIERLASAEKFNKEYDSSIAHYKETIEMYKSLGLHDKAQNAQTSLNLCYVYAGKTMGNTTEGEDARKQKLEKLRRIVDEELGNLEIVRKYLGETQYAQSLGVIAGCYRQMECYANSVDYYRQYMHSVRGVLRNEFQLMSEEERMLLWYNERQNIDDIIDLLVTMPKGNESLMPRLSELAYDCVLLSKGILLNSSIEFENVVASSGNSQLKEVYKNTINTNEKIKQLRMTAASDADMQIILQLQQQNQQRQLALYRDCAEIADFTDYIGYNWKDVKAKLSNDDIAIEFASINTGIIDSENYMVALVLTKEMKSPIAIPVCNFADLRTIKKDSLLYESPLVGNIVWGNLSYYIKDKQNVYFSADGDFNFIGIEYLQYEGKPLSEQKNVFRLSSTKQLCYSRQNVVLQNAVLFGGVNYVEEGAQPDTQIQRSLSAMRTVASKSGDDMLFANLQYTKKEIDEVAQLLSANKVCNILTLSDTKASVPAFMSLSDSKVNILHVATHGAYLKAAKNIDNNDAMKCSILAFAGANIGEGYGIVTAAEIAKMNLRQCKLVVLSACETGLGHIGEDGVFGLQRGFKNAGVNTILMSLRPVYDYATTEMMIQFYRALMAGQTPNKALRTAQHYLRNNGFDKPEYWATFIVLDGQ